VKKSRNFLLFITNFLAELFLFSDFEKGVVLGFVGFQLFDRS